ncbi:MAG TPA: hypothetical protein VJ207_02640 [Thermoplasmata archaeon]|nr:hypothetical protein [Thermoplasmata archaeon]
MHADRVLLALDEQAKWRERKTRVEEHLRQLQSRRRYLWRELELARRKVGEIEGLIDHMRGDVIGPFDLRGSGMPFVETRPTDLALLR